MSGQPSECPFCGCRYLLNSKGDDGLYRVTCLFPECGGQGPKCPDQEGAWQKWNGAIQAPTGYGAPDSGLIGG